MARLKLITFDLDNTLWPVDAVIRQAEQTTRDWLLERDPALADTLTRASQAARSDSVSEFHHTIPAVSSGVYSGACWWFMSSMLS